MCLYSPPGQYNLLTKPAQVKLLMSLFIHFFKRETLDRIEYPQQKNDFQNNQTLQTMRWESKQGRRHQEELRYLILFGSYQVESTDYHHWSNFKERRMQRFKVASNDAMRSLLGRLDGTALVHWVHRSTCEPLNHQLVVLWFYYLIEALVSPLKSCYRFTSKLKLC